MTALRVLLPVVAAIAMICSAVGVAHANHCEEVTIDDVTLGVDDDTIEVTFDCHEGGGVGRRSAGRVDRSVGNVAILTHYTHRFSSSDTQDSCYRISAGYDGDVDAEAGRFEDVAAAGAAAGNSYRTWNEGNARGGFLVDTDAADGVYQTRQALPCVDEADEIMAALITPEQLALIGWQAWAQPLAPAVLTEPTTYSVVGVPTLVSVGDYQPSYDIDGDPGTITWSLPGDGIELRATAAHRIRWNDDAETSDGPTTTAWLERNGRPYAEGDEDDGFDDPELIAHTYTVKGNRTIQVDVRWNGEWRNAGGAWEPLPAEPIYLVRSFDLDIRELQAVLTN